MALGQLNVLIGNQFSVPQNFQIPIHNVKTAVPGMWDFAGRIPLAFS